MHTIIIETELDNLSTFESLHETVSADPEMLELFPKMTAVIDSVEIELYTPIT